MLNFLDNNDLPRFLYRIGEGGGVAEATMMALYHNALLAAEISSVDSSEEKE